jgi:predicted nucleic acid-binding protein
MRTAIDSSVLLCILRRQVGWESWRASLSRAAAEGSLALCPVVFAECSIGFASVDEALAKFDSLCIAYDPIAPATAYLAGQTFLCYRRGGGPGQHVIPDFLIAAHASVQADRLAAIDRGYLRTYFPTLVIFTPGQ